MEISPVTHRIVLGAYETHSCGLARPLEIETWKPSLRRTLYFSTTTECTKLCILQCSHQRFFFRLEIVITYGFPVEYLIDINQTALATNWIKSLGKKIYLHTPEMDWRFVWLCLGQIEVNVCSVLNFWIVQTAGGFGCTTHLVGSQLTLLNRAAIQTDLVRANRLHRRATPKPPHPSACPPPPHPPGPILDAYGSLCACLNACVFMFQATEATVHATTGTAV